MPGHEYASAGLPLLGRQVLKDSERERFDGDRSFPIRALQIGEGNFLRGFADWMLQASNKRGLFNGGVAVTQPRPSGKKHLDLLKAQEGAYTLLVRGLSEGRRVEERETISVLTRMIDPFEEWNAFLALAEGEELEFVISNTTEAGLAYAPSEWREDEPVLSFPGRLTAFLFRRFTRFAGDPARGLVHLPCELVADNGDKLRDIVLRHAADWGLPEGFKTWVRDANRFLNTLVDRIVTGFPADEADGLFARWGYEDPLLTTAEPYYLWAIQGEPELDGRLPLAQAGLNVKWVEDLAPYRLRKVRILNGTHTLMATLGVLNGIREVREALEHPVWGPKFIQGLFDEIVPGLPLDRAEMTQYANETLERFRNPYIKHKLADIAMNGLSKWRVRLLPSMKAHYERTGKPPAVLTASLAALLRLYRPADLERSADSDQSPWTRLPGGETFPLRDDAALIAKLREAWTPVAGGDRTGLPACAASLLSMHELWEEDLTRYPGLTEEVVEHMERWEDAGE